MKKGSCNVAVRRLEGCDSSLLVGDRPHPLDELAAASSSSGTARDSLQPRLPSGWHARCSNSNTERVRMALDGPVASRTLRGLQQRVDQRSGNLPTR
jgi:hypothetical protein